MGPDNIPNEALKIGAAILSPYITDLFNVVNINEAPASWTKGLMYLAYKGKGDSTDLNNYRGLTVNNRLVTIYTSMLNKRLEKVVEDNKLLGEIQNGGRKGRRGIDSLFTLRTIIEKSRSPNFKQFKDLSLLFVDLTKAYDSVCHQRLWDRLSMLGFNIRFVNILKTLYNCPTITANVNGHETETIYVEK